ncbi:A/G-specific adenine glycosylase [Amorphus coralli]|uniref:A/G-specific adenine glycosylase n=1 Tax=Amorphus coralli TaxID=340680 RepID=UPI000418469A|nr:A/G-specific adenine glycosylase [Amorphus coralli]
MPSPAPSTLARNRAAALLAWYDRHARRLPWRIGPEARKAGNRPEPYRVWLSEIMLQQTTVAAVGPYFQRFVERWPAVADLAAAETDHVMQEWAGLGYYSRARNLKRCAEIVATEYQGRFPQTAAALTELPGIGAYTAAAIASIAFDEAAAVVDGNVERVVTRLERIATPLPKAKAEVRAVVAEMTPTERPGCFAQAMMDLGATICTPKRPACAICPLTEDCNARIEGDQGLYPVKAPKKEKPTRTGTAYVAVRSDGALLLRRRAEKGLLGGMAEVPNEGWSTKDGSGEADGPPLRADWGKLSAPVRHTFTHFHLVLDVYRARVGRDIAAPADAWWSPTDRLDGEALPTVMRKVIAAALKTD